MENNNRSHTAADTLRQMMADWDNATDEQRAEALRIAKAGADAAEARLLAETK